MAFTFDPVGPPHGTRLTRRPGTLSVSEDRSVRLGTFENPGKRLVFSVLRIVRLVLGSVVGAILVAALANIMWLGRLTLISPLCFGALLALALASLLKSLHSARGRGEVLSRQATQLKTVA